MKGSLAELVPQSIQLTYEEWEALKLDSIAVIARFKLLEPQLTAAERLKGILEIQIAASILDISFPAAVYPGDTVHIRLRAY